MTDKNSIQKVQEGFTLLRSEFLYRMIGEIDVGEYRRLQDVLNAETLKHSSFIHVYDAKWEKDDDRDGIYEPTYRTEKRGIRRGHLFVEDIDLIYPHKKFGDAALAAIALENGDYFEIEFPMTGLFDHIKGKVLLRSKKEDIRDEEEAEDLIAKRIEQEKFIAVVEPKNADLETKLTVNGIKVKPNAILVNTCKIKYFELCPCE